MDNHARWFIDDTDIAVLVNNIQLYLLRHNVRCGRIAVINFKLIPCFYFFGEFALLSVKQNLINPLLKLAAGKELYFFCQIAVNPPS
jgi:hypothetical protein